MALLPKIPQRSRIEYLLRKGAPAGGRFFTLRILPNRSEHLRFVVVASKRVSPHATVRNRARRRMTEAVRLMLPQLPKIGYDIGILVNQRVLDAPFEHLQHEIITHFIFPSHESTTRFARDPQKTWSK